MSGSDEELEILRGIWNAIKGLNRSLSSRIDGRGARIDRTNEALVRIPAMARVKLKSEIERTNEALVRIPAMARVKLEQALEQTRVELKSEIGITNSRLDGFLPALGPTRRPARKTRGTSRGSRRSD